MPSTEAHSLTAKLADFAISTQSADIPQAARETIRGCLLDFVGVSAYAARGIPENATLAGVLDALGSPDGRHVVVGATRDRSLLQAAFLNGTHAHTLDFDDTNQLGVLHPGAPIIPAALAAAELADARGDELLAAIAIGYEVGCRVGCALGSGAYDQGFHPTAIAGVFGAAAAAGRLLGISSDMLTNAFGLCGSRAAGSMQFLANGAWNKRMHPGFAAHDALWCVQLAKAGAVGAADAIEGRYGLLAAYTPNGQPAELLRDIGTQWLCAQTAIKPYPSCRFTHAAIDAVLMLRSRLAPDAAPTLRVRLSPSALDVVGRSDEVKLHPRTVVDGQFSIFFQLAVAWHDGAPTWESYKRLGDPAIEAFAERIRVESAEDLLLSAAEVAVEGTEWSERIDYPLGEPQRPLSWADIDRKFRSLSGLAYSAKRAEAISHTIQELGQKHTITDLAGLLRGE